jgi:hypothetical protein
MKPVVVFRAPWGLPLKIVSLLVMVLGLGAMVSVIKSGLPPGLRGAAVVAIILALAAGPLFAIRGYAITGSTLSVLRPGWQTRIPLRGLRAIETGGDLIRGSIRLFGNGGYWSSTGLFWNRRLGRYRMFANDTKLAVALHFVDRRIVVTPAEPEAFAVLVRERAKDA